MQYGSSHEWYGAAKILSEKHPSHMWMTCVSSRIIQYTCTFWHHYLRMQWQTDLCYCLHTLIPRTQSIACLFFSRRNMTKVWQCSCMQSWVVHRWTNWGLCNADWTWAVLSWVNGLETFISLGCGAWPTCMTLCFHHLSLPITQG